MVTDDNGYELCSLAKLRYARGPWCWRETVRADRRLGAPPLFFSASAQSRVSGEHRHRFQPVHPQILGIWGYDAQCGRVGIFPDPAEKGRRVRDASRILKQITVRSGATPGRDDQDRSARARRAHTLVERDLRRTF